MDLSGCAASFPESELTRVLSEKSLGLYHRLKQASELESARIDGLETCPSCPFSAIIDNPDEKLFRCQNVPDCGIVSCRKCRRLEHLPKTCKGESLCHPIDRAGS
jgi:TRIAD3 protein (E3 ubiquitin-protein ligase RNF216)